MSGASFRWERMTSGYRRITLVVLVYGVVNRVQELGKQAVACRETAKRVVADCRSRHCRKLPCIGDDGVIIDGGAAAAGGRVERLKEDWEAR